MLTGNNGILKRAGEAKQKTEAATLKEEIAIVITNRKIEKETSGSNLNTLKEDIQKEISNVEIEPIDGYTDVWYVCKNGTYLTVYEDEDLIEGKAKIWDGEEISCPEFKQDENNIWNWYIYKPSELKFLADFVNNGNSLTGTVNLTEIVEQAGYNPENISINYLSTKVYLMNNIDLGARQINANTLEEKWETDANKQVKWTPIGTDVFYKYPSINDTPKAFKGIFEGNNYSIRGVYVDESQSEEGGAGVFAGSTCIIQNLKVKNSYIKGKSVVGGIASLCEGTFSNCKNINTNVVATEAAVGGIVGVSHGDLEKCENSGTITGKIYYVGGIVGQLNSKSMNIVECKNTGIITSKGSAAGGIIGDIHRKSPTIIKCINEGKVSSQINTGGIIGQCNATSTLSECENYGEIEGTGNARRVGGIIGYIELKGKLTKCINKGQISGKQDVGGIIGKSDNSETEIIDCIDKGTIKIIE